MQNILVVADHHSWLRAWQGGQVIGFAEATPERMSAYCLVVLAPGGTDYRERCQRVFDWKRDGALGETRLIVGTYVGRHVWTPANDSLVERWVVHARSEREVLHSDRLAYVPVCLLPLKEDAPPGDDGYLFMGGRKWRELDVGLHAMVASGRPGKVITDLAPEGEFPGVQVRRERVPKNEYKAVLARSRLFMVPLKLTPISHGHVDVVTAIQMGKPVLVTRGCSCDDYIEQGVNGLLVRDNKIETWVEAIEQAWPLADRMAEGARGLAHRYHAWRYADYLLQLCQLDPGDTIRRAG